MFNYIKFRDCRADKKNMQSIGTEILLNCSLVSHETGAEAYEFILNDEMLVLECVRLEAEDRGVIRPIRNSKNVLNGLLFELNHVRVNPKLDNVYIIECLTSALNNIGVRVSNQPPVSSMAVCYKPLGEISDNVRLYLNADGKLVFLSPAMRPKLVYSRPKSN
jgi:hypothetical protein